MMVTDDARPLPDILAEMADDMALRSPDRTELRTALNWAAAAGRAQGAATERERIRQLAVELEAAVPQARRDGVVLLWHPFAGLLDGTP